MAAVICPPHSLFLYLFQWGKHLPPGVHRLNNTFPEDNPEDRFRVLPVVIVRDPVRLTAKKLNYTWNVVLV